MRLICTLFIILLTQTTQAQKLTGIWRGYFLQKEFNQITGKFMEDKYKYEVQINQLSNNALEGVTYSYKTTVFYGKASFKGIYTTATKNTLLKELKMLELKISNNNEPCLMTCYLDYEKKGKLETLTGTYTSLNAEKKTDCGEGTIYLEKVPESDFEMEPFLWKKKTTTPPAKKDSTTLKNNITITPQTKSNSLNPNKSSTILPPKTISKTTTPPKPSASPKIKPGAEDFMVKKTVTAKDSSRASAQTKTKSADTVAKELPKLPNASTSKIVTIPKVLLERENKLINTIQVDVKEVQIDYYDNGKIDNDTVTVYLNNVKVIDYQKLSYNPITLHLHVDENHPLQEIITVADNLGDEPPNTALMVITAGKKRYEVTIASDEKNNAKVIIEYKPSEVKVH